VRAASSAADYALVTRGISSEPGFVDGVVVSDGRRLGFRVYGPDSQRRVVFQYGTPGTRRLGPQYVAAAARANVQLLVIDRPGYDGSTRQVGRRVVDVVADVVAVLDELGWWTFAVWGGSGGAPHALACAAALPKRVTRCASVVGPAPFDADHLDWFAGMSPGNVEEFKAAAEGERAYRPLVERLAATAVAAVEAGESQVAGGYELPYADLRALRARRAEPGHIDRVRAAYTGGVDGWIDDCIALVRPWGFSLAALRRPVSVWYGLDDVLSPRAHARHLLTVIPDAEGHQLPAGGHVLGDEDLDAIYRWLTAAPAPR
jgi:pimeloyl-ACP methyl ester carboxylesterase